MNEGDNTFHPWPPEGKWIQFRWRKATWPIARPWYEYDGVFIPLTALTWFSPITFWFPFLTWNIKFKGFGIHGYIGWKPITAADRKFPWRDLDVVRKNKGLFVQLSIRGGTGEIG